MAALTSDYCHACYPAAVPSCSTAFVTEPSAGYSASLLSDAIIGEIDHDCLPKNDASVTSNEGGTVCATAFATCADFIIGQDFPGDACKDGG